VFNLPIRENERHRENRALLALAILASAALWLLPGLWAWRAFGG